MFIGYAGILYLTNGCFLMLIPLKCIYSSKQRCDILQLTSPVAALLLFFSKLILNHFHLVIVYTSCPRVSSSLFHFIYRGSNGCHPGCPPDIDFYIFLFFHLHNMEDRAIDSLQNIARKDNILPFSSQTMTGTVPFWQG